MFRVVGLLALCALMGCSQAQLEHQTDSFNRASANAIGEQTLLNAVRSSLDMPMSFTKLLKFTAGSMANGGFAPKFPFGNKAIPIFDFTPSLNWSGGVSQIEYADANSSGALASLNRNIGYDAIDRYVYQGFDSRILRTIFVVYTEVDTELMGALTREAKRECSHPSTASNKYACIELERLQVLCKNDWSGKQGDVYTLEGRRQVVGITNQAGTRCDFLTYQLFENLLRLSGFWSEFVPEATESGKTSDTEAAKASDNKAAKETREPSNQGIRFESVDVQSAYDRIERELQREAAKKRQKRKQALLFVQRSPKALLAFLGDLITMQNRPRDPFTPEVMLRSGQRVALFRVVRGTNSAASMALSVVGPDGQVYGVPQPEYGEVNRDQTLRVLAIAGEVVNGAISDKDFPAPASVVVRAFQ